MNSFFAFWCKFKKARSYFTEFWMGVVKYGCGHLVYTGPILESEGIHAIFQKKGKKIKAKNVKKDKIFENLDKNVENLKVFWKRADDWP